MGKFDLDDLMGESTPDDSRPDALDLESGDPVPEDGDEIFVRNDPSETPRPPDLTGSGLGKEIEQSHAMSTADPARALPTDAVAATFTSEKDEQIPASCADLCELLVKRNQITAEQASDVARVVKQTPGKTIAMALIELGIDEVTVLQGLAEIHRQAFERIDTSDSNAFDMRTLNKLGVEFCKANQVMPLRREGSRLVVGTPNPDDVFLLDDIRRRLNTTSIKHILVTSADIRGVIETLTANEAEEYSVEDLLTDVEEEDVEVVKDAADTADAEDADSSPVVRYV
ncbi:MAG TPA: hypothetical protein VG711_06190, partial [Phycisphaerales bacterium]|nr:hypothetical protein [Phycisphaerales bacterium]